jgi:hypothetical protein
MGAFFRRHGKTIGLVSIIVVIVGWMLLREPADRSLELATFEATFYDPVAGKYFTAASHAVPPIESPYGNEGVLARFFTCGLCSDTDSRFFGYYEKLTPAAQAAMKNRPSEGAPPDVLRAWQHTVDTGKLISQDGETWTSATPEDVYNIEYELAQRCDELSDFRECLAEHD